MEPLFIFMDLEAAHGNVYFGDIIEIGAQVDPRVLPSETFQTLVHTTQNLTFFVLTVCKIKKKDLLKCDSFPVVFRRFMNWVHVVTEKCSRKHNKDFYPVLVAHGGFDNDFMMIQGNLERYEMSLNILSEKNLGFADTYILAKKLRDRGIKRLQSCQLSIEKLFENFFPREKMIGQHRALADVEFMIKIFLESPLAEHFDEIPIASFKDRNADYHDRNTSKIETKILNENLPKGLAKVTHTMTLRRLLRNGLTYKRLQSLFEHSISYIDFFDKLKQLGIERKASKSIASRLASLGLSCRGAVEEEDKTDVEEDALVHRGKEPLFRSDSGYASLDLQSEFPEKFQENVEVDEPTQTTDYFYEMFVDDFFYPPETYTYTFGSFSVEEIKEIDEYIGELFDNKYAEQDVSYDRIEEDFAATEYPCSGKGDVVENVACSKSSGVNISSGCDDTSLVASAIPTTPTTDELNQIFVEHIAKMEVLKLSQHKERESKKCKDFEFEHWEDEIEENCSEFLIPTDCGRISQLTKDVPTGMTVNHLSSLNGEVFQEKVPLFVHYNNDVTINRPAGGIPVPTGKAARKQRQRLKRDNLIGQKMTKRSHDSSRVHVTADTGEVFVLV